MVDNKFLEKIGLNEEQIILLNDALQKEKACRLLLLQMHLSPRTAESILRTVSLEEYDKNNEELMREKLLSEWFDFIPLRFRNKYGGD